MTNEQGAAVTADEATSDDRYSKYHLAAFRAWESAGMTCRGLDDATLTQLLEDRNFADEVRAERQRRATAAAPPPAPSRPAAVPAARRTFPKGAAMEALLERASQRFVDYITASDEDFETSSKLCHQVEEELAGYRPDLSTKILATMLHNWARGARKSFVAIRERLDALEANQSSLELERRLVALEARPYEARIREANAELETFVTKKLSEANVEFEARVARLSEANAEIEARESRLESLAILTEGRLKNLETHTARGAQWGGEYESGKAYRAGEFVGYKKGSVWVALRDCTTAPGAHLGDWDLVIAGSARP